MLVSVGGEYLAARNSSFLAGKEDERTESASVSPYVTEAGTTRQRYIVVSAAQTKVPTTYLLQDAA